MRPIYHLTQEFELQGASVLFYHKSKALEFSLQAQLHFFASYLIREKREKSQSVPAWKEEKEQIT